MLAMFSWGRKKRGRSVGGSGKARTAAQAHCRIDKRRAELWVQIKKRSHLGVDVQLNLITVT
jgi:hypothetical protein